MSMYHFPNLVPTLIRRGHRRGMLLGFVIGLALPVLAYFFVSPKDATPNCSPVEQGAHRTPGAERRQARGSIFF